ncbi:Protein asteroid -like protein 1 [Halotydeus destructor]|nr:Protein asteroid -like protein 1 [Halotydeus destructor]
MGIKGFARLISDNSEQFTEPFELSNTELVIDGLDLVRFLYNSSKREFMNVQFAGNHVSFGRTVEAFFRNLQTNNVQAYVILHGAATSHIHNHDDKAIRDYSRAYRLEDLVKYSKDFLATNESLDGVYVDWFPVLSLETFKNVLKELKIPCISVPLNCDTTLVKVANELKCPVLSGDSDFYMFPLTSGFVDFSSISCDSDDIKCDDIIRGRLYSRSRLLQMFDIDAEVLPLFAVICGNAYRKRHPNVPDKIFGYLSRLNNRKDIRVELVMSSGARVRMVQLLTWLKRKTLQDATRDFFRRLQDGEERTLRAALELTIGNFNLVDGLDCALNHLQGSPCEESHEQAVVDRTGHEHVMPNNMAVEFINSNWIKEVAELKLIRETWSQLELDDYDQDSAIMVTIPMLGDLISITSESTHQDDSLITIHDWYRGDSDSPSICQFQIQVSSGFTNMVNYDSLSSLASEQRFHLALAILKSSSKTLDDIEHKLHVTCNLQLELARELALMVLILRYIRSLLPKTESVNMEYFMLSVIKSIVHYMRQDVNITITAIRKEMSSKQRLEAVYLLNIVQRIVKIFGQINFTLGCPLPTIKPEKYFNSVYITNLYTDYLQTQFLSEMDRELIAIAET